MLVFAKQTVKPPAPPVRDELEFEAVYFGVYQPTKTPFVQLTCAATSSTDPELGQEMHRLRLYKSAEKFLIDFCADPDAAVKAWIQAQTNEEPEPPAEPE